MLSQSIAAVLAHSWFRNHEPTMAFAAACLVLLPLAVSALRSHQLLSSLVTMNSRDAIPSLALEYLVFYFTLASSILVYRLSPFHPLAKYPGPNLCKATKLWGAWIAVRGNTHRYVQELHEQYGPVVRVGPNELSTTDKDVLPHVLGTQGMPRGPLWDGRRFRHSGYHKPYDSLIDVRDNNIHHQLRKAWNSAFAAGPVKDYRELLELRGKELREHLQDLVVSGKGEASSVDLAKWLSFFSFDFMGHLAFGGCFELMRNGDEHGFWTAMEEGMELPAVMQHIPWIQPLLASLPFISSRMRAFSQFGVTQSINRMQMQTKCKDLFYHLYEVPAEESGSSIEDQMDLIVSNSLLTIVAGSDTTATTLSAIFCHLLSDRKVYSTLRSELDEAFPFNANNSVDGWPEIEIDKLTKMPYLTGVINEGLRLVPAVPSHLQRSPEPGSGGKVLGDTDIFIPEGSSVNISPFAMHRDPRYFSPSPEAFIPERWLSTSDEKYTTNREAFIPFSYGPANCAGKSLAMIELRYIVAILVRSFDLQHASCKDTSSKVLEQKAKDWVGSLKDRFVFGKSQLYVDVTPRK